MAQATAPMGETTETGDAAGGADHTSPARLALADSLRRLGNGLVAHQPDDELLRRITAQVDDLLPGVLAAPERPHAFHVQETGVFSEPRPDGRDAVVKNAFPDCVVSGRANPMGIAARLWREGDEAVCQVTLGEAFEGAPGRAHGGIVAVAHRRDDGPRHLDGPDAGVHGPADRDLPGPDPGRPAPRGPGRGCTTAPAAS